MRIYATTTSERATKSQGGNRFVTTDFYTGSAADSRHFATVRLEYDKDDGTGAYRLELIDSEGNTSMSLRRESENKCKTNHAKTKPNGICLDCGYNTLGLTNRGLNRLGETEKGEKKKDERVPCRTKLHDLRDGACLC